MANLLVRNVEDEVVDKLKARSGRHGISAEEEHRRILRRALLGPKKKSFDEVLAAMPNVGEDDDLKRIQKESADDVFS